MVSSSSESASSAGGRSARRRRRHRSRSRRHHRRRRHDRRGGRTKVKVEKAENGETPPQPAPPTHGYPLSPWDTKPRPNGPPVGWYGSASSGPQLLSGSPDYALQPLPPHGGVHPIGPGSIAFGHSGPVSAVDYMRPPLQLPRASPFAVASPVPSFQGKGAAHFGPHHLSFPSRDSGNAQAQLIAQPEGLVVSNVPADLNTLDVLNRHFRKFGEVLKITVQASEGRAFVQFADRTAAEAAVSAVVLDRPEVALTWAQRGGAKGKSKGKDRQMPLDRPAENRVLCADTEALRRLGENKRKRDEIAHRRATLLANLTEQLKAIMSKLIAKDVPEARQEALRAMILQVKEKMNALNAMDPGSEDVVPGKGKSSSGKRHKSDSGGEGKGFGAANRYSLDLRPKVMRISFTHGWSQERLREELTKLGAAAEKISCVHMEGVKEGGQDSGVETALVQFKSAHIAEQIYNQRGELPFQAEWCDTLPPPPVPGAPSLPAAPVSAVPPPAEPEAASALPAAAAQDVLEGTDEKVVTANPVAEAPPPLDSAASAPPPAAAASPVAPGGDLDGPSVTADLPAGEATAEKEVEAAAAAPEESSAKPPGDEIPAEIGRGADVASNEAAAEAPAAAVVDSAVVPVASAEMEVREAAAVPDEPVVDAAVTAPVASATSPLATAVLASAEDATSGRVHLNEDDDVA